MTGTTTCRWCGVLIVRHETTGEFWHEALPLDGGYRICGASMDDDGNVTGGHEPIPGVRKL